MRLDEPRELSLAVDHWLRDGKKSLVKNTVKLDEAFTEFKKGLEVAKALPPGHEDYLRELSARNLATRVNIFVNGMPNLAVSEVSPDAVKAYLESRNVSPITRDNDRRAISRFFAWCAQSPRRWTAVNPARAEKRKRRGEKPPPQILTVEQCEALLRSAMNYKEGLLAPYVALSLFAGLRPWESKRLTWDQVNLSDRQITLTSSQTKTKRNRIVKIHPTLAAWLKLYQGKQICGPNWRRDFDAVKLAAGFGGRAKAKSEEAELTQWTPDILRHTAISHHFRDCLSFGATAEQFDNSELIIRRHYQNQANATSKHTKAFYKLKPAAIKATR